MSVIDDPARSRYEMLVEGHVAIADYRLEGSTLYITHVEVPPELRGGGVAGTLMAGVVLNAKARGLTLHPICSYAVSYLKRHPVA